MCQINAGFPSAVAQWRYSISYLDMFTEVSKKCVALKAYEINIKTGFRQIQQKL